MLITAVDTSLRIFDEQEEDMGISLWLYDDLLCLNKSRTVGLIDIKLAMSLLEVLNGNVVVLVW